MLALKTDAARRRFRPCSGPCPWTPCARALGRYLTARLGRPLAIRPVSELGAARHASIPDGPAVCSDGTRLYLPGELDAGGDREANIDLYKLLARLEAGHYEHGTLDFDLERLADPPPPPPEPEPDDLCEIERFFSGVLPIPQLAEDLFNIAEHGRLTRIWQCEAPGLWRILRPRLAEALSRQRTCRGGDPFPEPLPGGGPRRKPAAERPVPIGHCGSAGRLCAAGAVRRAGGGLRPLDHDGLRPPVFATGGDGRRRAFLSPLWMARSVVPLRAGPAKDVAPGL